MLARADKCQFRQSKAVKEHSPLQLAGREREGCLPSSLRNF